jgi:unsaturated rhamnogalacturonyl hydrolase
MSNAADLIKKVADRAVQDWREGATPRSWGDGILMLALLKTAVWSGDRSHFDCACQWLDDQLAEGVNLAEGATWDWGALPLPALELHRRTGEERYLAFAREVCEHITSRARRTADGAVVTHAGQPQLWVDSMYFTAPALTGTAAAAGEPRYLEEAAREVELHALHLRDETTGLFYHMWDEESGQRSPCLWARGNAWAALAILDVLAALPAEHPKRGHVADISRRLMEAALPLQDDSGLWHTVIDRPDSYLETSCAAMFAFAVMQGVRRRLLPSEALAAAARAWEGVARQVSPDGRVTGVSAGTPPGDFDVYQNVPLGSQTYGTGFFLLAGL